MNNKFIKECSQISTMIEKPQTTLNKARGWLQRVRYRARRRLVRQRNKILQFPRAEPLPQRGDEAEIIRLITCLRKIRGISPKELHTSAEIRATRFTNYIRLFSIIISVILFIIIGLGIFDIVDKTHAGLAAAVGYLTLLVLVPLWMSWDLIAISACLFFFPEYEFITRKLELAHDLRMAAKLRGFDLNTLKTGERWLEIKLGRIGYRLFVVFGNSDKIALFTLAALVISVQDLDVFDVNVLSIRGFIICLIVGLTIGALLVSAVTVTRLRYQKEIVSLAIGEREGKSARHS